MLDFSTSLAPYTNLIIIRFEDPLKKQKSLNISDKNITSSTSNVCILPRSRVMNKNQKFGLAASGEELLSGTEWPTGLLGHSR